MRLTDNSSESIDVSATLQKRIQRFHFEVEGDFALIKGDAEMFTRSNRAHRVTTSVGLNLDDNTKPTKLIVQFDSTHEELGRNYTTFKHLSISEIEFTDPLKDNEYFIRFDSTGQPSDVEWDASVTRRFTGGNHRYNQIGSSHFIKSCLARYDGPTANDKGAQAVQLKLEIPYLISVDDDN